MNSEILEERINGLKELINQRFDENKQDHNNIIRRQDYTNGRVADLVRWKWYFMAYAAITVPLIWYLLKIHIHN